MELLNIKELIKNYVRDIFKKSFDYVIPAKFVKLFLQKPPTAALYKQLVDNEYLFNYIMILFTWSYFVSIILFVICTQI